MKKNLAFKVMLFTLLIAMCSCGNPNRTKLQVDIERTNESCPAEVSDGMYIESVTYNKDANEAIFTYLIKGENEEVIESLRNTPGLQKQVMSSFLQSEDGRKFLNLLVDAEASLTFVYRGEKSESIAKISFSNAELKELIEFMDADNNDMKQMEDLVALTNAQCPSVIEEGMTMTGVRLEMPYMVFYYELDSDELTLDVEDMNEFKTALRDALYEELTDAVGQRQLTLMKKCGMGVKYVYEETVADSTRVVEVAIEPAEIAEF